ncbi:MAG: penicillin-binding protein activator [Gammaproteobacteria bacterium]|nr:penicillin-binding protein activator [Gammaproteobacteria bacterium]
MKRKFAAIGVCILLLTGCIAKKPVQTPFTLTTEHPEQVALLLPLHGPLAASGQAIKNGFLAAYYYSLEQGQSKSSIKVIDTSGSDVSALYRQAIKDGADFVVGPLTKGNVQEIIDLGDLPTPTLALNTVANYTDFDTKNLYQFGLFTEDEITQMAVRAWQEHPGRALIIAPQNAWGQTVAKTLQKTWQELGGEVATTMLFDPNQQLEKQVAHALNVDLSLEHKQELRKILWKEFKFTPRRRQDVEVIFLIAPPKIARQIRPLLQFYFAGNLPVYATSIVYSGRVAPSLDKDLDGIIFCDMPWLLEDPATLPPVLPALRQQITKIWPRSYSRYPRLYALGIDSYYLMLNLNKLLQRPDVGIAGATGVFYIDNSRHIYRQLDWAVMQNGVPHLLSEG